MSKNKFDQIQEKIRRHIQHTLEYCQGVSRDEFFANRMLQEACVFNVLQVGELSAKAMELGIALAFYTEMNVSIGYCAEIAGMTEEEFVMFLGKHHVDIFRSESDDELMRDVANA